MPVGRILLILSSLVSSVKLQTLARASETMEIRLMG